MRLDVTSNHADGKRKWDKKTFCLFCHCLTTNFVRHLVHRHESEPEVEEIAALETGKEKYELISKLRKRGAFVNNAKVLASGKGKVLIQQRVGKDTLTAEEDPLLNFTPCLFCHGYYKINGLASHMRNCSQKVEGVNLKHARAKSKLLRPVASDATARLKEQVVSKMRDDQIREVISQDSSILLYGGFLLDNLGADRHKDVRLALRLVARFLLGVQKASDGKCTNLEQVLDVPHWDTILQAVIYVMEDEYTNVGPGKNVLATGIGIHLVKICTLLEAQCLVKNDREMLQKIVEAKKRLETEYKTSVAQKLSEKETEDSEQQAAESASKNDGIRVESASTHPNGKRKFDKKSFCMFCECLVTNFCRHLSKSHPYEAEVEKLLALPSGKEKCNLLTALRHKGAFMNNNRVLSTGKGTLMVKQRCSKYKTLTAEEAKHNFSPCLFCHGYYTIKNLAQHVAQCSQNTQGVKVPKGAVRAKCKLLKLSAEGASDGLKEAILSKMKDDKITDIIFQDPSILHYGNFLLDNVGSEVHLYKHVKAGMREVARFMFAVVEISEGQCGKLEQVLDESKWDLLVEAVKRVCGDEDGSGKQQLPGRIRQHLLKICSILKTQQPENAEKLVRVKDLLNTTYKTTLIQPAPEPTQAECDKEIELPSEIDLQTLHSYLKKSITEALGNLVQNPSGKTYSKLASLLQVQLFLFSGRKVTELTQLSKEKYDTRAKLGLDVSLAKSKNIPSSSLAKELYRTEVFDNHGKKVPVLFSTQMVRCLNVLIDHRETVGVETSNGFLFARPRSEYPIRAGDGIKQIVSECSVKFPGKLASDKVRSHIARVFQCFELGADCPVSQTLPLEQGKKQGVSLETDDFNDSDGWEFAGDDLFDRSAANSPEVEEVEQLQNTETVSKKNYIRQAVFSLPGPSQPECNSEVPNIVTTNEQQAPLTEHTGDFEALSQFEPGILSSANKIDCASITTLQNAVESVNEADGGEVETQRQLGTSSDQVASSSAHNHLETIVSTATSYEGLKVDVTSRNEKGKMRNDKRTCCIFCKQYVTNFSRHLKHRHKTEPEVQKIMAIETGLDKDRQIDALRKRGAFLHNAKVLSTGEGTLMLKCRSGRKQFTSGEQVKLNYSPCLHCQAYYSVNCLTSHMRKCSQKVEGTVVNPKYARGHSKLLKPIAYGASEQLKQHILAKMRDDMVSDVVCQDSCILRYGTYLLDFYKDELHRYKFIRATLRDFAKFVLVLRRVSNGECANVESILDESKWDLLLEAVSLMVQESGRIDKQKEHLASSIARGLEKICSLLETKDGETTDKFAAFKKLLQESYKSEIKEKANLNKKRPRRKKENQEPVAADVTNVFLYMKKNIREATENVVHDPCTKTYAKLVTLLQSQLVFFNGRKFAEIGRIYKENYECRDQGGLSVSAAKSLNIPSQMLASQLDRIDVLDMCEEKVPVLFTRQMVHSVNVLVNHRDAVGVKPSNPYLFARPCSEETYRAGDSVKSVTSECNVEFPEALRASTLRKQVASMFQRLEFSDNLPVRQEEEEEDSTTTDIANLLTNLELGRSVREKRTPLVAEIDELMDGWDFDGNGVAERPPVYAQRINGSQPLDPQMSCSTKDNNSSMPGPSRPDTSKPRSASVPAKEDSSDSEEEDDPPPKKAKKGKNGKKEKNKESSGRTWTKWSDEEIRAARTACASSIQQEVQPRKVECEEAFKMFPILAVRCNNCWKKLKDWVKSDIEKNKREKKLSSK
ncbi:hypothetical protein B566_EDAN017689 [Ephemera danica]|nr:hypothetical protein B566_EDAN017689 [Ephemera danica]